VAQRSIPACAGPTPRASEAVPSLPIPTDATRDHGGGSQHLVRPRSPAGREVGRYTSPQSQGLDGGGKLMRAPIVNRPFSPNHLSAISSTVGPELFMDSRRSCTNSTSPLRCEVLAR